MKHLSVGCYSFFTKQTKTAAWHTHERGECDSSKAKKTHAVRGDGAEDRIVKMFLLFTQVQIYVKSHVNKVCSA